MYGQVTEGVVVRHVYAVGKDAFEGGSVFSVINYSIGERAFDFYAGENVIIPLHEKVRVIYNTRDVEDCRVYSLKGLYLGDNLILPLVLLIFWIAVYLSLPKKK